MDCLNNIIGLSETTCPCYDPKPSGYNISLSGIFLDRLEGLELELTKSADDCGRGGLWDRMAQSVEDAKRQFIADILSCVKLSYKPKQDNWTGILGGSSGTSPLNPATNYAGLKISPLNLKGAYIKLKRFGVLVNQSVPVTLKVFSNENNGTLIAQYTLNATANVPTFATISPSPLELPMWSYNVSNINYYFVLDIDGTFLPLNTKKDCGCGGVQKPYLKWLDFIGIKGNTSQVDTWNTNSNNETFGVILDVEVFCKMSQIICTDDEPLDFSNNGYAMQMAYAIRFKAGELLLNQIYSSPNINRFTLLDREKLQAYSSYYRDEYNKWIDFLCKNVQLNNNECFTCRDDNGLLLTNIKV